ncbi:MAG: hypothetical protein HYU66_03950 [Armatimonadetes bacterium]|nr:hypothetical protein [Armatimonadota bacterium]
MTLTESQKRQLGLLITFVAVGMGVLVCLAEWMNVEKTVSGPTFAERAFIFLFGAVHVAVAAIITVYRRTAT